jgi:hypothetical protein
MKRGIDLFLLILALGLSVFRVEAKEVANRPTAEIHHAEKAKVPTASPSSRAYLNSIYPPGESGVNISNSQPRTNSETESRDDSYNFIVLNTVVQSYAASYLTGSDAIEPGLSIKELIFPFHSFL